MRPFIIHYLLQILLIAIIYGSCDLRAGDSLAISFLPRDSIERGYGCICKFEGTKSGLDSEIGSSAYESEEMSFGISGQVIRFKKISLEWVKRKKDEKITIGDEFIEKYKNKNVQIELRYTVIFVCPQDSEGGCEVTRFSGKLILFTKNNKQEYRVKRGVDAK